MKSRRNFFVPENDEAIEATAAAWLAQRDDGLSDAEAQEFARWRAADPRHEAAVRRLEATWSMLQSLRDFRPESVRHPDRDLLARPPRRRARLLPRLAIATTALAAAVALGFGVRLLDRARDRSDPPIAYTTTAGGFLRVALADGSTMELNSASEAHVEFTAVERRVRLLSGESGFTVAKDPARPFVVVAGRVSVRAVGTAFNVRLTDGAVDVLVTEGTVNVAPSPPPGPVAGDAEELRRDPTTLIAGQRAVVSTSAAAAVTVETVAAEELREAVAWQGPRLVFVDTPLADVVEQFNRRNQVQLEVADAALGALPIGGSFRAENVEAFVRLITADNEIVAQRIGADRIVLRRGH